MSPGSSTESYPAFARIELRENPGKNLNQVTCPDRDSNPGHLVSRPDALTVTPQPTESMYHSCFGNPYKAPLTVRGGSPSPRRSAPGSVAEAIHHRMNTIHGSQSREPAASEGRL
ncbi:hypothetical protein ANN_02792 [Periplaneta americana]|uniref:Uncharacterized protein n=1 Tax=Periplaneta americana TaxID=6978 RepID=A0ABQ8TXB1_PERAM|nr:hypothetical protein ANN_02792 [Periplaneta americana]